MKKLYLLFISLCIAFCTASAQNQIPQFQVNGNATQLNDLCYRLTNQQMSQSGSIWCLDQIDLNNSFDVTISVNLGCIDDNGADGLVFGFQPVSTNVGTLGGGLGFEGIAPSVGIEFDTYQNGNPNNDPFYDHVAIMSNGVLNHSSPNNLAGPIQASSSNANIEDCNDHLVRVIWDAATTTLSVYFDCVLRLSYTDDIVNNIFGGDGNVFWGFTAATGALFNEQSVCLLDASFFEVTPNISICAGSSAQLNAPSGSNYQWTPAATLNNPNIQNPLATPTTTTTYVVTYVQGCQTLSDTIVVNVGNPSTTIIGDDTLCEGETSLLDAGSFFFYQWSTGETSQTISVNQAGTYTVTVFGDGGCPATDEISISINEPPTPTIIGNLSICNGGATTLSTNQPYTQYIWSNGTTNANNTINTSGDVFVTVTDANGCTGVANANVVISNSLEPQISGNLSICEGETTTLSTDYFNTYQWSTGDIAQDIEVISAGTYTVTVSNANGCLGSTTATVAVNALPTPSIVGDVVIGELGYTQLDAGSGYAVYNWSSGGGTSIIQITQAGTYTVTVTNQSGCTGIASIAITKQTLYPIAVPNAFSPNNDNHNDYFRITTKDVKTFDCIVYNRWGQKVFESNNINDSWNGMFKGTLQEMGIYAYSINIEFNDGTKRSKKGNVTLLY